MLATRAYKSPVCSGDTAATVSFVEELVVVRRLGWVWRHNRATSLLNKHGTDHADTLCEGEQHRHLGFNTEATKVDRRPGRVSINISIKAITFLS